MLHYQRFVSREALEDFPYALDLTKEHVRAHLSSIADADDDPETNADDVYIEVIEDVAMDGYHVIGKLDAEANAPYLREDYDPGEVAQEE